MRTHICGYTVTILIFLIPTFIVFFSSIYPIIVERNKYMETSCEIINSSLSKSLECEYEQILDYIYDYYCSKTFEDFISCDLISTNFTNSIDCYTGDSCCFVKQRKSSSCLVYGYKIKRWKCSYLCNINMTFKYKTINDLIINGVIYFNEKCYNTYDEGKNIPCWYNIEDEHSIKFSQSMYSIPSISIIIIMFITSMLILLCCLCDISCCEKSGDINNEELHNCNEIKIPKEEI